MKVKTNRDQVKQICLMQTDVNQVCRAADLIENAGHWTGDDESVTLAAAVRAWLKKVTTRPVHVAGTPPANMIDAQIEQAVGRVQRPK